MSRFELKPFPSEASKNWKLLFSYAIDSAHPDVITLLYEIEGPHQIDWPKGESLHRAYELWKATCFELFLKKQDERYLELNFAPQLGWDAYHFDGYRYPHPPNRAEVEVLKFDVTSESLKITLKIPELASFHFFNATAVIKEDAISYFAIHHRPDKADFHHLKAMCEEL